MKDYLIRGMAYDGHVRAFAVRTTDTMREIQKRLDTWPIVSAALGRTVSAAAMMGAMLKGDERLTVIVRGNGPVGQIVADANARGEVRGYVHNPHVHYDEKNAQGKLDVRRVVGTEGSIIVTKDLGLKEPYQGTSPIVSGEIGEDITYYLTVSEQVPSAVGVGVLVNPNNTIKASGGFIIQLMPNTPESIIEKLEQKLAVVRPVSTMIDEGMAPEEILKEVLGADFMVLNKIDIVFSCHCSLERVQRALISLGKEELDAMINEQGEAEITCHFCNEKYHLNKEDLENLRANL
ncbi:MULTISPECIES: Hsp33 family molecular chaperone HslO [Aneurinibacillus]|uniref:33 kDa chaperonin n=1 Tax=Aneurinibacillus thermoaerophilus TaxID=143495 RepID=A0A1G8EX40_ANETH|nr:MULTISPECIES: Hsp33 family molecular chaperone HslO [Aneurinibacillus]AMA74501.1 molecular chaperone Hsp33 [Aneurinibacillus sp. XH2]MED0675724.1 Hsp33 family molecular chaperone HslO [Aneurinibacillus thermoaerophilus]MED0681042.1 Hsp33 family molecular chaperone HslO [Aneurinibacillus thermoaerophilus]MED0736371.1 Hsp33 family molecular chaperone HslO [Aneurinibacillus thermoaerophilus]MED0757745.1 Hsp33 family molecular chaperone HslO [Aneurinibacillus thermoaerophilus]